MPDYTSGTDFNEKNKTKKIVWIIISSIIFILLVGTISGYLYIKSALEPVNPGSKKSIIVEVPVGSSAATIGDILEKKGVIKDARVFRFYAKVKKKTGFKAGEYAFTPSMDLAQITTALQKGYAKSAYHITVPEGKALDEIAQIYAKQMAFTKEDFLKTANDRAFIEKLMKAHPKLLTKDILNKEIRTPLEGYLFAATYDFSNKNTDAATVIERMIKASEKNILPHEGEIKKRGMTIHEAVTMASLVEKESGALDQRAEIAGVFYNRLEKGMRLQTDPTILYALGKHKSKVYFKDLKVDSPYNTYQNEGLPVGPISNFGKSALEAVLSPKQTDSLYFLHDENGKIHFAKDFEEHAELKRKYIK